MTLPPVTLAEWWSGVSTRVELTLIYYFFLLNASYIVFSLIAFVEIYRHLRRSIYGGYERIPASPLTPAISILVPAHNEHVGITLSVTNLLHLDYMRYEVIVVDDGSVDGTLDTLREAFHLEPCVETSQARLPTAPVRSHYRSRRHPNLLVISKENGGKADALNAGLNYAAHPYFCTVDADVVLEPDALLRMIKPIVESPRRVVAVGGIVRVANGCRIENGRVVEPDFSRRMLVIFQVVEYFRSFLCGRTAFSRLDALMIVSGAFGVFDRELGVEIGGYRTDTVGEDMDLVARMHVAMRARGQEDYAVIFVPDPVCWTEAPETLRVLARQRRRWQRGLFEVLSSGSEMMLNPRYGRIGMIAYPFYWLFEGWGLLLEFLGYIVFVILLARGAANSDYIIAFFIVALLCGTTLSLCGILVGEMTPKRYPKLRHWVLLVLFAVLENLGYRLLLVYFRLLGLVDYLIGRKEWGRMERRGLDRGGVARRAQDPA